MTPKLWIQVVGIFISLAFLSFSVQTVAAATVTKLQLKGDTITAQFDALDPEENCLENFVFVVASDMIQKESQTERTRTVSLMLSIVQKDICTEVVLFSGEGAIAAPDLEIAANLKSATLTAKVPVFDTISQQSVTFDAHLVWNATAKPKVVNSTDIFRDRGLGIFIKSVTHSKQAQAIATGTVFGNGQHFTPEASDMATIENNKDSSLTIEKTP